MPDQSATVNVPIRGPGLRVVRRLTDRIGITNSRGTQRRSPGQVLLQIPGDWLFERSRIPADLITLATMAATAVGGFAVGTVFAVTLAASKIPFAANVIRAVWYWDLTYWTRPQAHQPVNITDKPLPPLESDPNAKGVPRWLRRLTSDAEKGKRAAAFADDWLNQRSRVPAFVIEASLLVFGIFVAPIPWVVLFPLNAFVSAVPALVGAYLGFRNHDFQRWSRGGMRQRDGLIPEHRRRGHQGLGVAAPTPATPALAEAAIAAPAPVLGGAHRLAREQRVAVTATPALAAAPGRGVELTL